MGRPPWVLVQQRALSCTTSKETPLGLADRIGATTDRAVGAAKDRLGAATGNAELQAQGLAQNAVGRAGGHGQDVEGAAQDISGDQP
ncbi:hypothetical protein [Kocuria sp. SM24M-10]|uniref:CsbD family protein n=1 Tax=Kocuria sp. SM24M-10 TaxID=1660349 RepID=UPI0009E1B199|nr:hypothetical protein [Kocuria sp. SM24M-10]